MSGFIDWLIDEVNHGRIETLLREGGCPKPRRMAKAIGHLVGAWDIDSGRVPASAGDCVECEHSRLCQRYLQDDNRALRAELGARDVDSGGAPDSVDDCPERDPRRLEDERNTLRADVEGYRRAVSLLTSARMKMEARHAQEIRDLREHHATIEQNSKEEHEEELEALREELRCAEAWRERVEAGAPLTENTKEVRRQAETLRLLIEEQTEAIRRRVEALQKQFAKNDP